MTTAIASPRIASRAGICPRGNSAGACCSCTDKSNRGGRNNRQTMEGYPSYVSAELAVKSRLRSTEMRRFRCQFRLYRCCRSISRSQPADRPKVVLERLIQPLIEGKSAVIELRGRFAAGRPINDMDRDCAGFLDRLVSAAAHRGQQSYTIRRSLLSIDRYYV